MALHSVAMRAGVYARLSRDTEASTSIERQREACLAYAASRGWDVALVAEDVDVSGSKIAPQDRAGFAELLDAGAGVDVIVAYRIDRVARSVGDFAALLKDLDARGVALASATEPFDLTTPLGKALVYLVAIFAEMEAEAIAARVRSSIAKLRRTSRWSHGPAPYGYRAVPFPDGRPGKTLVIDAGEAAVLRETADRVLAGERCGSLARELNARGVPAPAGDRWRGYSLRDRLTGDPVLGRVRHQGKLVRDDAGVPLELFPPVLDVETVERLRALLISPDRPARVKRWRLCTELLVCGTCGRTLAHSGRSGYRCANGVLEGCPRPVTVKADWIEAWVDAEALARHGADPVRVPGRARPPVGLADLEAQIGEVTAALAASGEEEEAELLGLLRVLKRRRTDLERASTAPASVPLTVERDGELVPVTLADVWPDQPDDSKNATLRGMGVRVVVAPGKRGARSLADGRATWTVTETGVNAARTPQEPR